ncbi:MAG: ATP-grasp domain-containing protein [Desulfuromonadales bacterium]|nr:ATP-grasp domain-containing protein [Desulfuromonadales bacterium]
MKNIFVVALGDFNRRLLQTIRNADDYRFHSLLPAAKMVAAPEYPMADLLDEAQREIKTFEGTVDAIVGYWDFPTTLMLPTLRQMAGLPTTSAESVLRCVHKYWSRILQREAAPDLIPRFVAFDPFADDPFSIIDLDFPYWIKPIKAHSSILGFRIERREDFQVVLPQIRERIGRFSEPFNYLFERAEVPPEISAVNGNYCLAEEIITAENQCTLEGYVFNGEANVYGVVDSLREENRSSFNRYHYPSRLPGAVQQRMIEVTEHVLSKIGLDNEPFNIEFFHNPETDSLSLLEINPRISKSHCPLFFMVEGASHHEVMVELALGLRPKFPHGGGTYPMATKFMVRRYEGDALVRRIPRPEEIAAMQQKIDGIMVKLLTNEGERLSDLADQDSYSFEYANIFIGGQSEEDLQDKYHRCMDLLPFEFESLPDEEL